MTPEEEKAHNKFMEQINRFLEHLRGKALPVYQPEDDDPADVLGEVDLETGEVISLTEPQPFHLDSVPVSLPPVKADTKHVPNTLRDMVEGK